MSSLVLVDRAEAVPADQKDPLNPLYFGTTLIYPNLGTPVARSKRGSLVFFYTARAAGRPLTGRVELLQDQRVVASRDMAVPAADATGLVQHANELPLDEIGAGPYELRVTLSDGGTNVTRSTRIRAAAVGDSRRRPGRGRPVYWCACGAADARQGSPAASGRRAPAAPCFSR